MDRQGLGPASCPVLSLYTEPVEGPYKQPWRITKTHSLRQPLLSTEHPRKILEALRWLHFISKPCGCQGVWPPTEQRRNKTYRGRSLGDLPSPCHCVLAFLPHHGGSPFAAGPTFVWPRTEERKQTDYRAIHVFAPKCVHHELDIRCP